MNTEQNQNKISDFVGRKLMWVQTNWLKSKYELRAKELCLATLTRKMICKIGFSSFATGESDEGCWTFKRVGFLKRRVMIRNCDQDDDIAVFKNAVWKGGGTLELSDGRNILVTTNFWETKMEFNTEQGELLFAYKIGTESADLTIEAEAAGMPELPWMVMLGEYLIVMMQQKQEKHQYG
jgi:hypothetical protein